MTSESRIDQLPQESPGTTTASIARRYALLLGLALFVVALDQLIKAIVTANLQDGRVVELFGGLIQFDYTANSGAAFGIFKTGGSLFAVVAILVSLGIVLYYRQVANSPILVRVGLALILGGAIGNLIDRIRLGHVVDFVDLGWWPVFNLADSCIVIGVAVLILHALLEPHPRTT